MEIIIATRKSELAQAQADFVGRMLVDRTKNSYKKNLIVTEGDRRLDVTLDKIGGKGVFTKEVELALIKEEAHIAVHSMKDVPYKLGESFEIIAIPKREDCRDAFISNYGVHFNALKSGAKIGTSSIRRASLLKEIRSDIEIVPIRGNIQTRFKKMEEEKLDGMVLASAGIKRLNMERKITDFFDPTVFLPAIGQGALGVECLKCNENKHIYKVLEDEEARIRVEAERRFMKELNGDCHSLIGAYTRIHGDMLYMIGTYLVNGKIVKKDIEGKKEDYINLGKSLGQKIIGGL